MADDSIDCFFESDHFISRFLTLKRNMQAVVALAGRCRRTCRRRHDNRKLLLSLVSPLLRLRWSIGSVLAFDTQVRGLKPGRSRRIFQGEKILTTPSFGRKVKPFVPCRRFTACKRSLNVTWKSGIFRQTSPAISLPSSSSFSLLGSLVETSGDASRND